MFCAIAAHLSSILQISPELTFSSDTKKTKQIKAGGNGREESGL